MTEKIKFKEEKIQEILNFIKTQKNKPKLLHAPENPEYIKPDIVLSAAFGNLQEVLIGGIDNENNFWFASSTDDGGVSLWILEHFKETIIENAALTTSLKGD